MKDGENDAKKSRRAVIGEGEILSFECGICHAKPGKTCKTASGLPYAIRLDDSEFRFHAERIYAAINRQMHLKMPQILTHNDKCRIVYYAFIMLADACAVHSAKLFERDYKTEELQTFFIQCAITELRKDGLIDQAPRPTGKIHQA